MAFRRAKSTQGNTNCQKNIFEDDQVPGTGHHPRALTLIMVIFRHKRFNDHSVWLLCVMSDICSKECVRGPSCLDTLIGRSEVSLLRPAGSDPGVVCQKNSFLKVSVSLGGFGPSVAHGKHSVRRRCVQATKNKAETCSLLDAIGRRSCGR